MNRFFTSQEVYEDRLAICRECIYYFKPTGQCKRCLCFMRLKARLAPMECPEKMWQKTTTIETPEESQDSPDYANIVGAAVSPAYNVYKLAMAAKEGVKDIFSDDEQEELTLDGKIDNNYDAALDYMMSIKDNILT